MADYLMAYDFGTSGTKAVLIDYEGNFIAASDCGYPLITPCFGYVEQDPDDYWEATCNVTRNVIKIAGIAKESVKGISFGTQGMGIIPVDKQGKVLYNNITWADSRAITQADKINSIIGEEAQNANDVVSKLLWLKENKPDIYKETKYFLDCTGYLVYKSTGIAAMELTNSGPYSLEPEWKAYKERLYSVAGIDLDKMPPLKICTEYVGNLTPESAEELGLTTNTTVFMGTGDVGAAAAGCGCCQEGDASIYLGSSAWLSVMRDKNRLKKTSTGIYQITSIDKDILIYGGCVQSACMTQNWAIQQFYGKESQMIKSGSPEYIKYKNIFSYIDDQISNVEPGSKNMIATPWLHGEHCPVLDEKARAVFLNVTSQHDRRHFINAILEGICYSLRWQTEYYTRDTGLMLSSVGAVGGGALSDHWMQMMSDIMNLPVYRTKNAMHAGAIGAAIAAGVGLGLYKCDQIKDHIGIDKTFYPRQENVTTYDRLYGIFKKVYPSLKDIFADLNNSLGM